MEGNPIQRRGWWEGLERRHLNWCPLWYSIGNSPSMERVIILSPATSAYRGGSVSGGNLSTNPSGQGWLLRSNPLPGGYFGESQPKEEVRGRLINGERIIKGAKVGYNMETLPSSVNTFNMNPIVRICRVIGGLSIVIWLGYYKKLDNPFNYIIFLLASIQFIYMFIILTIKVVHIIKQWRKGSLEVRNSPHDNLASLIAKLVVCVKTSCTVGAGTGVILGLGIGFDDILEGPPSGRAPIFAKPTWIRKYFR